MILTMYQYDGPACYRKTRELLPQYGWPEAFRVSDWHRDMNDSLWEQWTHEARKEWQKEERLVLEDQRKQLEQRLAQLNVQISAMLLQESAEEDSDFQSAIISQSGGLRKVRHRPWTNATMPLARRGNFDMARTTCMPVRLYRSQEAIWLKAAMASNWGSMTCLTRPPMRCSDALAAASEVSIMVQARSRTLGRNRNPAAG